MRKLKLYLAGFIPGLLLVFFILNKKGASCSGYLPDSRVRAETLTKDIQYSSDFKNQMKELKINDQFIKDSILTEGTIDFDKSHAQKKPCPDYILYYPEKNPRYEISFEKCPEKATFITLKKIR